jgi:hypothetical protein
MQCRLLIPVAGFSVRQVAIQVALPRKAALYRELSRFLSACHFRVYAHSSCAEMRLERLENRQGGNTFGGSNPPPPPKIKIIRWSILAAFVPRPRLNLRRFHGVFAPNFKHRAQIVPRRARGRVDADKPLAPMTWPLSHTPVLSGTGTSCPMGAAPQARVRHRHRGLSSLRRHRGTGIDCQDLPYWREVDFGQPERGWIAK